MKRIIQLTLVIVVIVLLGILAKQYIPTPSSEPQIKAGEVVQFVEEVLKIGVVEIHVSQIYELSRGELTISSVPIPWTKQKSLIAVKGNASVGYDLEKTKITIPQDRREILVSLPEPSVLAIDVDYKFLYEDDTFLNRLTPEDRNSFLKTVKAEVKKTILNERTRQRTKARAEKLLKSSSDVLGIPINPSNS